LEPEFGFLKTHKDERLSEVELFFDSKRSEVKDGLSHHQAIEVRLVAIDDAERHFRFWFELLAFFEGVVLAEMSDLFRRKCMGEREGVK
jgi:hypothetical protein